MLAWWETPRRKGLTVRAGPPSAVMRRTTPWNRDSMRLCSQESSGRPSVGQPTGRGEGVSYRMTNAQKTGRTVAEVLREKHPCMCVPPVENPACAAFEEYEDVPEMVPVNFTEDDVTWFTSKLSGAAGALGAEAMELRNWLLRFRCASEEFRVVVASLDNWMANLPHLGHISRTDVMSPSGAR